MPGGLSEMTICAINRRFAQSRVSAIHPPVDKTNAANTRRKPNQ
jgi:hypothetical protein